MNSHNIEKRARQSLELTGGLSEHKKIIHNLLAKLEGTRKDRIAWKEATIGCDTQYLLTLKEVQELAHDLDMEKLVSGELRETIISLRKEIAELHSQAAEKLERELAAANMPGGEMRCYGENLGICQEKSGELNNLIHNMGKQLFDTQAANTVLKADNALLEDAATCMERTVDYFCQHVTRILRTNAELRGALDMCKQALAEKEAADGL